MLRALLPCFPTLFSGSALAGDDWIDLESAVAELDLQKATNGSGGPVLSGFVRVNYAHSDDIDFTGDDEPDELSGFSLDAARLQFAGDFQGWGYFVSVDGFSGSLDLLDAYVTIPCTDVFSAVVGQFKTPFLRTGLMDEDRLLFIAHTRNGIFYSVRDRGAQFQLDQGAFHAQAVAQNGSDQEAEELLLTARASVDLGGGLARVDNRMVEGAYGAPDEFRAELGIAVQDDQALDDGEVLAAEGAITVGRFYAQAEILAYGESPAFPVDAMRGDTDPFSVTGSFMLDPEHWEIALRYEDFDDSLDRVLGTAGVNYYLRGHDLKFQLNAFHLDSDGGDEDTLAAGATVSF